VYEYGSVRGSGNVTELAGYMYGSGFMQDYQTDTFERRGLLHSSSSYEAQEPRVIYMMHDA
jgi:hypothetical protein